MHYGIWVSWERKMGLLDPDSMTNSVFLSLAPPRPDPPGSVRITSMGTTTITITWLAPAASVGNRISHYSLVLTGGATITVSASGTSYTFTGLQEYTRYSCVITAVNIYGLISVPSAAASTTTLEGRKIHNGS